MKTGILSIALGERWCQEASTDLYHSNLRFAVVPEEYHCRFIYPFKVSGKVKVLHGRHPDMASVV